MSDQDQKLTKDELEAQKGEPLPAREVMSTLDLDPGLIAIPKDPTIIPIDDPRPDSV